MPEVRIFYSESLVQSFERALQTAYSPPYVQLTRRPSKTIGRFNVVIVSGGHVFQAADAEDEQSVIQVCGDVPPETFWVGFKAAFDLWQKGQHFLEHISVSLFQRLSTGDLIRMFRAEWDSRTAADTSSNHAQPHWHFAMETDDFRAVLGTRERIAAPESENVVDFVPETQTDLTVVDFSTFHFAMSPLWYPNTLSPHRQIFRSDEELTHWFHNLSQYIAGQLAYVTVKMGAQL